MKVSAKYEKINLYGCGERWILKIRNRKSFEGIQFSEPSDGRNDALIRSLLKDFGFELVKFKDLPD